MTPWGHRFVAAVLLSRISAGRCQVLPRCVSPEQAWSVELLDTGGNGWEGGTFMLLDRDSESPAIVQGANTAGRITLSGGSSAFRRACVDPSLCYEVVTTAGSNRDQVSWVVRNATSGGATVLTGDTRSTGLTVGECTCTPEQFPLAVVMTDSYGDGWGGIRLVLKPDDHPPTAVTMPDSPPCQDPCHIVENLCLEQASCFVVEVGDGMHSEEIQWALVDPNHPDVNIHLQGGAPFSGVFQVRGLCRSGCTDPAANNFDATAQVDNGNCAYNDGCMDNFAMNFDDTATRDNGACLYGCETLVIHFGLADRQLGGCEIVPELPELRPNQPAPGQPWPDVTVLTDTVQILHGWGHAPRADHDGRFIVQDSGALALRWVGFEGQMNGTIIAAVRSEVYVHHCRFEGNRNPWVDASTGWMAGAAIHSRGAVVQITSSQFVSNAGFARAAFTYGGAIFVADNPTVEVTDCSFFENEATHGGAIFQIGGSLRITDTQFDRHTSTAGGAIESRGTVLTMDGCMIERSGAQISGGAGSVSADYEGAPWWGDVADASGIGAGTGGIGAGVCASGGELHISGCTFEANTAGLRGGAIVAEDVALLNIESTFFTRNGHRTDAADHIMNGGAIYVAGGHFSLQGSFFDGNEATGQGDAVYIESVSSWLVRDTAFSRVDAYTVFTTASPISGCSEHPCDPGYECLFSDLSMRCERCPSFNVTLDVTIRTVSLDGISCRPCPAGFTSSANQDDCVPCPEAMYSTSGICLTCPLGYKPNEGQTSCDPCELGTYSGVDETGERITNCVPCSRGKAPNAAATACETCQAGRVSPIGAACVQCEEGYGPSRALDACDRCEGGTYSVDDPELGYRCAECPAGRQANSNPQTLSEMRCDDCQAGMYSAEGQRCSICAAGSQPNEGQTGCITCASVGPGLVSPTGRLCSSCAAGQQPNEDTSGCENCTAGYASPFGRTCDRCTGNTVSNPATGNTQCTPCPAGSLSDENKTDCSCGRGDYDLNLGWIVCYGAQWDGDTRDAEQEALRAGGLRRCTQCPWCMDCSELGEQKTKPGYEFVHSSVGSEFFALHSAERRSTTARGVLKCPVSGSCLGVAIGDQNTQEACRKGFDGVLCNTCERGYDQLSHAGSCRKCAELLSYNVNWLTIVVAFVLAVSLYWVYNYALPKMEWIHMVNTRFPRELGLGADLKTVIGLFQILCLLPSVFRLEFPDQFANLLPGAGLLYLDFRRLIRGDCFDAVRRFFEGGGGSSFFLSDFYFFVFVLPAILLLWVLVLHTWGKRKITAITNMRQNMEATNRLQATTVARLSFVMFLVYPMITATVVAANMCIELSESYHVLATDYTVRCDPSWLQRDFTCTGVALDGGKCTVEEASMANMFAAGGDEDRYISTSGCPEGCEEHGPSQLLWMQPLAQILVVAFTFGVPCLSVAIIYMNHRARQKRAEEDPDGLRETLSAEEGASSQQTVKSRLACFGQDFRPGYRMFEAVEYLRKAVLLGVVGSTAIGSVQQIYGAAAVSLASLVAYAGLQPYSLPKCNVIRVAAEMQLLLTLVTSLVLRYNREVVGSTAPQYCDMVPAQACGQGTDNLGTKTWDETTPCGNFDQDACAEIAEAQSWRQDNDLALNEAPVEWVSEIEYWESVYGWLLAISMLTVTPVPLVWLNIVHFKKLSAEGQSGTLEARLQYLIANDGAADAISMKDKEIAAHRAEIEKLKSAIKEFGEGSTENPLGMESEFEREFRSLQNGANPSGIVGLSQDPASDLTAPGGGRTLAIQGQGGAASEEESSSEESSESDSSSDDDVPPTSAAQGAASNAAVDDNAE